MSEIVDRADPGADLLIFILLSTMLLIITRLLKRALKRPKITMSGAYVAGTARTRTAVPAMGAIAVLSNTNWDAVDDSEQGPGHIGYKRALIHEIHVYNGELQDVTFKGLMGTTYKTTDEGDGGKGFHSYMSPEAAFSHTQNADSEVYLEVLGYGKLLEHGDGYKTTYQRVLQVIFGDCGICLQQACFMSKTILYCSRCVQMSHERTLLDLRPMMFQSHILKSGETVNIVPKRQLEFDYGDTRYSVQKFVETELDDVSLPEGSES